MNNQIFKIVFLLSAALSFLYLTSCSSLKGKYCYNTQSTSECIDFKKDKKFEYDYWIDTGSDKGFGEYEVTDGKVVLNFKAPSIESTPLIEIRKINFDSTKDTVGVKNNVVFNDTENFIKIVCRDKQTEKRINIGGVSYYNSNGINLGRAEYFGKNTININIKNLDFPITLKFEFLGYLEHEITLEEKAQYFILAELAENQGYNLTSGQKKYDKADFLSKKPKNHPSLQEKKFIKQ